MIPHVSPLLCIVYRESAFRFVPAPEILRCGGVSHTLFSPTGKLRPRKETDRGHAASGGGQAECRIWLASHFVLLPALCMLSLKPDTPGVCAPRLPVCSVHTYHSQACLHRWVS